MMITVASINHEAADLEIDGRMFEKVPLQTWHEAAGPGWRSYTAVAIDWPAYHTATNSTDLDDALADDDDERAALEAIQTALEDHERDERDNRFI